MEWKRSQLTRKAWDVLVSDAGGGFSQAWGYGDAANSEILRAELQDGDHAKPLALAQLLVKKRRWLPDVVLLSRGPVWIASKPPKGIRAPGFGNLLGMHVFLHTPEAGRPTGIPIVSGAYCAILDLSPSIETLFAGLHGKWRNRLRRAQSSGLVVEESRDLDGLIERYVIHQNEKGFVGWPEPFLREMCSKGGQWIIHQARDGQTGAVVAAVLILNHGRGSNYMIGWSNEDGRRLNAQNLVLWTALTGARARGARYFDLGRLEGDRAPGLVRFKLGTGAKIHQLGETGLSFSLGAKRQRM